MQEVDDAEIGGYDKCHVQWLHHSFQHTVRESPFAIHRATGSKCLIWREIVELSEKFPDASFFNYFLFRTVSASSTQERIYKDCL